MKKMLALLLTLCLLAGLLPATALAADTGVTCNDGDTCTQHEAAIGDTHYDTIGEAIDAANSTSSNDTITIKLLKDATRWKILYNKAHFKEYYAGFGYAYINV